ncbi:hypothetical protein BPO_p0053 (plasmid) [Bergeyella porcorum]|uniref:Uncharacterized protein n=1 Tax=Bergeyella porcorum TaxID=1735111 RepID=A0AAU0F2Y1_9FLAO
MMMFIKITSSLIKITTVFFDLFEDGSLAALAKGGVGNYAYQWQKESKVHIKI